MRHLIKLVHVPCLCSTFCMHVLSEHFIWLPWLRWQHSMRGFLSLMWSNSLLAPPPNLRSVGAILNSVWIIGGNLAVNYWLQELIGLLRETETDAGEENGRNWPHTSHLSVAVNASSVLVKPGHPQHISDSCSDLCY